MIARALGAPFSLEHCPRVKGENFQKVKVPPSSTDSEPTFVQCEVPSALPEKDCPSWLNPAPRGTCCAPWRIPNVRLQAYRPAVSLTSSIFGIDYRFTSTSKRLSTRVTPATCFALDSIAAFSCTLLTGPRNVTVPPEVMILTLWAFIDNESSPTPA
jgi:hypothetical protein